MSDRETLAVEYSTDADARYRVVFEPAANGGWKRTQYTRRGCEWRPVGTETVTALSIEQAEDASATHRL